MINTNKAVSKASFQWLLKMAWRDGKASRKKLVLFTASIVLGIAAVVSIQSFGETLKNTIDLQSKSLMGADFNIDSNQPPNERVIQIIDSLCGAQLNLLSEDERALLRNNKVGFVFQDFQLLPTLTALENVAVPLELQGDKNATKIGMELLEKVGLADRYHHYPSQLSGGEQQRVAVARAFSNKPSILFADEPTGNLDAETGEKVVELLFNLNKELGTTLVIVTHDIELAQKTQHILRLKGGKIIENQTVAQ
jgi:predicted ABC-type transport system involved in lysophospholipase L1 biosynthesis ATPase subunit